MDDDVEGAILSLCTVCLDQTQLIASKSESGSKYPRCLGSTHKSNRAHVGFGKYGKKC